MRPIIVRAYDAATKVATPLLTLSDPALNMRIQPSHKPGMFMITLINPEDREISTTLSIAGRTIKSLQRVNPVGLPMDGDIGDGTSLRLKPRSTMRLMVLLD